MKINGRPATSGTLVIGAGEQAEINLPWGPFALVFNPDVQPMNISLTSNTRQIVFDGTDNSLGLATTLQIPLTNGQRSNLALAVYAIGHGSSATRIVHYTVS